MKKLFTLLLFCVATFASAQILDETFDSNANFTTSDPFFSDGFGDFFGLSGGVDDYNGEPVPTFVKPYTGFAGGFLTGMDLDGEGATLPITLEWLGLDIDGTGSLMFSGQFAEAFDTPGDIDAADFLLIEYQIDGGGYQNLLSFVGGNFSSGSNNGFFIEDADFDGTGDGATLTDAAATFMKAISGTGSLLDLRMTVSLNSGDEDFAVDSFSISGTAIVDVTPPVVTCPTPIMQNNDAGICGAIVTFADATATDDIDPNPSVTQTGGPVSGTEFPVGDTMISYTAVDAAGNESLCTFTITVVDAEAPVVSCPTPITQDNDAGVCGAVVTYDAPSVTDNCPESASVPGSLTTLFDGGNTFDGNMFDVNILNDMTVQSFDVNLVDATGDFEVYYKTGTYLGSETNAADWTLIGSATGVVSLGANTPTPLDLSLDLMLTAGQTYAFYVTSTGATVAYTNGGVAGDVLASNADLEILEGSGGGYPFGTNFSPRNFNGTIVYESGGFNVQLIDGLASGEEFPVGTTTVTYEVSDAAGNVAMCSFDVIVNDTEAPVVVCPENQLVDVPTGEMFTLPDYSGDVTATDNCTNPVITQSPAAGMMVGAGTTTITITVTDATGNEVDCAFDVIVTEVLGITTNDITKINLSPNPASTIVSINATISTIEVFNMLGQKVLETNQNTFDVSSLIQGAYLVKITTDNGQTTKKLTVK